MVNAAYRAKKVVIMNKISFFCLAIFICFFASCKKANNTDDYSDKTLEWIQKTYASKEDFRRKQWIEEMLNNPQSRDFLLLSFTDISSETASIDLKLSILNGLKLRQPSATDIESVCLAASIDKSYDIRLLATDILIDNKEFIREKANPNLIARILRNTIDIESNSMLAERKSMLITKLVEKPNE